MAVSTEKKVGFFFLLSLIALAVMIELVQDWNPFQEELSYVTYFNNAVGINVGDPVKQAGVSVGKVKQIGLEDERVRVDFNVNEGTLIRRDSVAQIRQTNLLGGSFLGIDFGSSDSPPLESGGTLRSVYRANIDQLITSLDNNQKRFFSSIDQIVDESSEPLRTMIQELRSVSVKINQGQGTLGKLINDSSLYDEVAATVATLKEVAGSLKLVAGRLEAGEGTLGQLLVDDSFYRSATSAARSIDEIAANLRDGKGTLGRLYADEQIYTDLVATTGSLRRMMESTEQGEGTLGMLLTDKETGTNIQEAFAHINSIARKIDSGEGTLGQLVNDEDIYHSARTVFRKVGKAADGLGDSSTISALGLILGALY